ncbi:MAG TPA: NAD-dependent epimerase/dehydratase family protein [Acidisphaera sp.]|nr:NAD-dependent epimerase/dehydratase family protein [Acidisphaera sp.]
MARKTVLVAGAHGLIGRALIELLDSAPDSDVIGLGRRGGAVGERARIVPVDLLDRTDAMDKLGRLTAVTHIVFAAWTPPRRARPKWRPTSRFCATCWTRSRRRRRDCAMSR